MDAVLGRARQRVGTAHNIDLAVGDAGRRRAAPCRHRRERLPAIGSGIVLPGIVDRPPGRRAGLREREAAERVDLVVHAGERDVMRRQRHRLLLGPFV